MSVIYHTNLCTFKGLITFLTQIIYLQFCLPPKCTCIIHRYKESIITLRI